MTKTGLASSAALLVLLAASVASAQQQYTAGADSPQWLKDRRYNEGIGVRTGDFELHPGIAGEVGYDSNWLLRSSGAGFANSGPDQPVIPAARFRITPSLYLSTLGQERREGDVVPENPTVAFRGGVNATYMEFVGLSSDPSASIKTNDISGERNVGIGADATLSILPGRTLGGAISATYGRLIQPNEVTADPSLSFISDNIGVGGELAATPGGGTLDWHLGYGFHTTIYETDTGKPYDNSTHEVYMRGHWRFRPRTALIYDGTLDFTSFGNAASAAPVALYTSMPARARLGMDGLITDRFAALIMGGWGATFFDQTFPAQPQYDSFIGQAELKWFLSPGPGVAQPADVSLALSSVAVGFVRDFQSSLLGAYFGTDRGYLKLSYFFAGRALTTLEGGVGTMEYPNLYWADNTVRHASYTDIRADATLFSEYRFTESFGLNATLRYSANISPTTLLVDQTANSQFYDLSWNRFEAFLGLRFFL